MSSIGRTHHLRCQVEGCTKRRPYWSSRCKKHRAEVDERRREDLQKRLAAAITHRLEMVPGSDAHMEQLRYCDQLVAELERIPR